MLTVEFNGASNEYRIQAIYDRQINQALTFTFNSYLEAKDFIDAWFVSPISPFTARFAYQARHGSVRGAP